MQTLAINCRGLFDDADDINDQWRDQQGWKIIACSYLLDLQDIADRQSGQNDPACCAQFIHHRWCGNPLHLQRSQGDRTLVHQHGYGGK